MKYITQMNLWAILFLLTSIPSNAQFITTYAGNGTGAYSGDGGPATAAGIYWPIHTARDAAGNIYITEYSSSRVRKINGSGIISTIAGNGISSYGGDGGAATAASLNNPSGIAIDGAGNIYIADYHNSRIRKVNAAGVITTIAGTGIPGYSGDGGPATAAAIRNPYGIITDASGNIYFADRYNNRIRKISSSGTISTIAGTGTAGWAGDGGPATSALLNTPAGLTSDISGNLYFAEFGNHTVRKISTSGVITTVAGSGVAGYYGDGGPATNGELNYPHGVAVDSIGNIFVGDYGNNVIRRISPTGVITTVAGTGTAGYSGDGGPATAAQFNMPQGVSVYETGKLYICDVVNNRVRILHIGDGAPNFTKGDTQILTICNPESSISIDTMMSVFDSDTAQILSWSVLAYPVHGTIVAGYSATSTGDTIIPTGLSYMPSAGYIGSDVFQVRVSDGILADTTTVNITINSLPNAGIISGPDSVCPGQSVNLSETMSSGFWTSNGAISLVSGAGVATGVHPGKDTIVYTVINSCGITSAIFPFYVKSYIECHTGIASPGTQPNLIKIYPNPSNGAFIVEVPADVSNEGRLAIYNVLGEKETEFIIEGSQTVEVNTSLLPGQYFIVITSDINSYAARVLITK